MRRLPWILVMACVLSSTMVFAQRPAGKPQDFQARELTPQEREESRTKARYKMNTWHEAEENLPAETPFPWMPIGFTLLAFAAVAPFAWAMYKRMSSELEATEAAAAKIRGARAKKGDDEPEAE